MVVDIRALSRDPLETEAPWNPPCDPLGTACGTDIEPLQAGMAEIERKQLLSRSHETTRRAPIVILLGSRRKALPAVRRSAGLLVVTCALTNDEELERRIEAEVDDYENEAACTAPEMAA